MLPAAIERDILIACAPRLDPVSSVSNTEQVPGSVTAENLQTKYTRQSFCPGRRPSVSQEIEEDKVHVEAWELDINTKELRWESYVKAGYYVCFHQHLVFLYRKLKPSYALGGIEQIFSSIRLFRIASPSGPPLHRNSPSRFWSVVQRSHGRCKYPCIPSS